MVFGGVKGEVAEGDNISPFWTAEMRDEIEGFKQNCHDLSMKLLQLFAQHFGLPADYFVDAHKPEQGPGSVLRMLHYPKLDERPEKNIPRLYAHTDWGSLTFVWPQGPGLEVETPSKAWMEVPLVPGSMVVNVGDAMSLWSGKTLKSTLHKINFDNLPIDQERWSMAYFVNANSSKCFSLQLAMSYSSNMIGAPLEILRRDANGTVSSVGHEANLTMGDYISARLYMSQRQDAKNNWTGQMTKTFSPLTPVVKMVEQLGIANGDGVIDFTPVKA
jgi:isopenicillin N synthase-like dioxygenase